MLASAADRQFRPSPEQPDRNAQLARLAWRRRALPAGQIPEAAVLAAPAMGLRRRMPPIAAIADQGWLSCDIGDDIRAAALTNAAAPGGSAAISCPLYCDAAATARASSPASCSRSAASIAWNRRQSILTLSQPESRARAAAESVMTYAARSRRSTIQPTASNAAIAALSPRTRSITQTQVNACIVGCPI
jgi:hypothetical protein